MPPLQRDVSLNDLLKEGELLSVLGTLAYSPEGVTTVLDQKAKDERYAIDSGLLYRSALPIPITPPCECS